ncbi:hypothetical protein FLAV_01967 [Flavobacteriales bacterium]|nr:hypothetical protein FLAV_01967 [Flavobacteriales bacterium]
MKTQDALKLFTPRRIAIPIVIGLGAAGYMLYSNFDAQALKKVEITGTFIFFIFLAFIMMLIRDLAYMYRIRVLTDQQLSWRKSFDVIMLWEFASAITPSVVGGSGVALFILNKEGINLGRSTAVVMVTAFLDELFYIIMVPLVLLAVGVNNLFPVELQKEIFGITLGTKEIFIAGYVFILFLTITIIYAVFISPIRFKKALFSVFKMRILKKWRLAAVRTSNDLIITSAELKEKPLSFWAKAFGSTLFSWTARFWVVNFIILAFASASFQEHLLIYARQLVMWVIMLISPTPGSSGVAEFAFSGFLREFTPAGLSEALALLWRFISYYPYLFIGAIVLPRWVKRVFPTNTH